MDNNTFTFIVVVLSGCSYILLQPTVQTILYVTGGRAAGGRVQRGGVLATSS